MVVVCSSSSNSNNGEKVNICSSKNELSSKKFFLFSFSFIWLFFSVSLEMFSSILAGNFLLFFENGFFQTDDLAQYCLIFLFFSVIFSKEGQYCPYILGKRGFTRDIMRGANTETRQDIFV